jgi:hypothetical protein
MSDSLLAFFNDDDDTIDLSSPQPKIEYELENLECETIDLSSEKDYFDFDTDNDYEKYIKARNIAIESFKKNETVCDDDCIELKSDDDSDPDDKGSLYRKYLEDRDKRNLQFAFKEIDKSNLPKVKQCKVIYDDFHFKPLNFKVKKNKYGLNFKQYKDFKQVIKNLKEGSLKKDKALMNILQITNHE